jgi:putative CocE/NonD family hydrolase
VKENFTKREVAISMRDGAKLFTVIYAPRDTTKKYPILMTRTPYGVGPYGEDKFKSAIGPNPNFLNAGYIFVYQDVRGCYMSEGKFVNMTPHRKDKKDPKRDLDESTDTYDTIDWLIKHVPNNNGNVGHWGISYPGFYAAAGMIDAHPALKAVSPQAPIADWWYDDFHHHGAFFLPHAFNFFARFGHPRPEPTPNRDMKFDPRTRDGYQFFLDLGPMKNAGPKYFKNNVAFWDDLCDHPNYDEFWQSRNLLPHLKKVAPAVMTVGGWFDAEDLTAP